MRYADAQFSRIMLCSVAQFLCIMRCSVAQFSRMMLDCCLYLLDASMLSLSARGNPVDIVRAICSLVGRLVFNFPIIYLSW